MTNIKLRNPGLLAFYKIWQGNGAEPTPEPGMGLTSQCLSREVCT